MRSAEIAIRIAVPHDLAALAVFSITGAVRDAEGCAALRRPRDHQPKIDRSSVARGSTRVAMGVAPARVARRPCVDVWRQLSTSASASISTSMAGSTRRFTSTKVVAGRTSVKNSPWARPTFSQSLMSVT